MAWRQTARKRISITSNLGADFQPQRRVPFRQSHNLLAWSNATGHALGLADIQQKLRDNGIDPAKNSIRGLTPGLVDSAVSDGPRIQGGRPRDSTVEPHKNSAISAPWAVSRRILLRRKKTGRSLGFPICSSKRRYLKRMKQSQEQCPA